MSAKLLEYAVGAYERQVSNFDRLDTKAATFAGFIGIILTVSIGPFGQAWLDKTIARPVIEGVIVWGLLAATGVFLAAALLFSLLTLRLRNTGQPLTAHQAIALYRNLGQPSLREQRLLKQLTLALARAEDERLAINRKKARSLHGTTICALAATITAFTAFAVQVMAQSTM